MGTSTDKRDELNHEKKDRRKQEPPKPPIDDNPKKPMSPTSIIDISA